MGICQTSSIKSEKKENNKRNVDGQQKQNMNHINKSQTVRMFDYNTNKIVEVPVLVPATQNSLYSKRQTHSPNSNPNSRQLLTLSQ
ncbi:unnamed protein product [Paramecium sonneborni]|uniref:Uncharacterized protein n=1 Tax=Paramecium sonneborni TaxID=65129 RepID=A0A8S1RD70_9CILI|nr:unnamed protein product [Paramecium sonneborni]